jgi:hypothetical protein
MAVANSYSRIAGTLVTVSEKKIYSYYGAGPTPLIMEKRFESYHRNPAIGTLDSSNTAVPRITNMVQRVDENIGDLSGKIYNSTGNPITLVSVQYSSVGITGPWTNTTVLSGDPAYNLPNGDASGQAFNIPFEGIADDFVGDLWFRIEISY